MLRSEKQSSEMLVRRGRMSRAAIAMAGGRDVHSVAALALARAGDTARAQQLAGKTERGLSDGHVCAKLLATLIRPEGNVSVNATPVRDFVTNVIDFGSVLRPSS